MLLVWCVFIAISIVAFSIVMFATSPATSERTIARRFWGVLKSPKALRQSGSHLNHPLPLIAQESGEQLQLILRNTALVHFLRKLIAQSHVNVSVKKMLRIMIGLALIAFALTWYFTQTFILAAALSATVTALPIAYLYRQRKKWLTAFNAILPECIDLFSRSLKAGQSIVASFDIVAQQVPAPANSAFADVFKKQKYGLPMREALHQMVERIPSMDLKILVTAILVQREAGGNLPSVLDRLNAVIRDRIRIRREIRTQTAQGRLTGWILGLLPPFLLLVISWINPNYASPFLNDPIGRYMLYTCVALLTIGVLVIQRMVHGIEV